MLDRRSAFHDHLLVFFVVAALYFAQEVLIPLGIFFPLFGMLVMLGASNAVNLTDGLDGLAIVPTIICAGVFSLIAYLVGNRIFADYPQLNPVVGAGSRLGSCSAVRNELVMSPNFIWHPVRFTPQVERAYVEQMELRVVPLQRLACMIGIAAFGFMVYAGYAGTQTAVANIEHSDIRWQAAGHADHG